MLFGWSATTSTLFVAQLGKGMAWNASNYQVAPAIAN
jgi:hypothetical protein